MAWIKSYQELERHPKLMSLMTSMEWDVDTAIGKLHRFWWWCLDYAPDGNVSRFGPQQIGRSCDTDGGRFIEAMVKAGFMDSVPYLRLHDWWDYAGEFLRGRLTGKPEQLKAIKDSYYVVTTEQSRSTGDVNTPQKDKKDKKDKKDSCSSPAAIERENEFKKFWAAYPRKTAKDKAWEAWKKKNPPIDKCLRTLSLLVKTEQWTREDGRFIPHPTTWLNGGRWNDVPEGFEEFTCGNCQYVGSLRKGFRGRAKCPRCGSETLVGVNQEEL